MFTDLPDLVLLRIAQYLTPEESQALSLTCKRLQSLLPRFLVIRRKDLVIYVYGSSAWTPFTSEPYFEGPHLTRAVKKLYICVTWQYHEWGTIRGDIYLTLMRGSETIFTKRHPLDCATHREKTAKSGVLTDDPIVTEAREGDYCKFTEGGWGHRVHVKNYI